MIAVVNPEPVKGIESSPCASPSEAPSRLPEPVKGIESISEDIVLVRFGVRPEPVKGIERARLPHRESAKETPRTRKRD